MLSSFAGSGQSDTVYLAWDVRDEAGTYSDPFACLALYYVGTTQPTSRNQFYTASTIRHDQWTHFTAQKSISNSGTIYVAFGWQHPTLYTGSGAGEVGFDCVDVNIPGGSIPPP